MIWAIGPGTERQWEGAIRSAADGREVQRGGPSASSTRGSEGALQRTIASRADRSEWDSSGSMDASPATLTSCFRLGRGDSSPLWRRRSLVRASRWVGRIAVIAACSILGGVIGAGASGAKPVELSRPGAFVWPAGISVDRKSGLSVVVGSYLRSERAVGWLVWQVSMDGRTRGPAEVDARTVGAPTRVVTCAPYTDGVAFCLLQRADRRVQIAKVSFGGALELLPEVGPEAPMLEIERMERLEDGTYVGLGRQMVHPCLVGIDRDLRIEWIRVLDDLEGYAYDVQESPDGTLLASAVHGDLRKALDRIWIGEVSRTGKLARRLTLATGPLSVILPTVKALPEVKEGAVASLAPADGLRLARGIIPTLGWARRHPEGAAEVRLEGLEAAVVFLDAQGVEVGRAQLGEDPFAVTARLEGGASGRIVMLQSEMPALLEKGVEGGLRLFFFEPDSE